MTETLNAPRPPSAAGARLARDPDDRVLAGVCAAFGRYTGTDPVLWRVSTAVLTVFGGAGLVLYALGWLLVPRTDQGSAPLERLLARNADRFSTRGVVLTVVALLAVGALLDDGSSLLTLAVLGGVAYLLIQRSGDAGPVTAGAGSPAGEGIRTEPDMETGFAADPAGASPPPWQPGAPPDWPLSRPPASRRPRSALGGLTVSAALLLAALLLTLRALGVDGLSGSRIVAAMLLVVAGGLLVGTLYGRARWLILVGLALALALGTAAVLGDPRLQGGVGQRTWVPVAGQSRTDYRLGLGEATLDLTRLRPGDLPGGVRAEIGIGSLIVLVPADAVVAGTARIGLGDILTSGPGVGSTELSPDDHTHVRVDLPRTGSGDATVQLELVVGAGEIEVRRAAS